MKKYIRSAQTLYYEADGRRKTFYLDFDDPSYLYDFFDDTLGRDFTNQFKSEFEYWKDAVVSDAEAEVNVLKFDTEDFTSQIEFDVSEIRDIVKELKTQLSSKAFSGGEVEELAGGVYDEVKRIGMFLDSIDRSIRNIYTKVLKMEKMKD